MKKNRVGTQELKPDDVFFLYEDEPEENKRRVVKTGDKVVFYKMEISSGKTKIPYQGALLIKSKTFVFRAE